MQMSGTLAAIKRPTVTPIISEVVSPGYSFVMSLSYGAQRSLVSPNY